MKIILFSSIHIRNRLHEKVLFFDVWDWKKRAYSAFKEQPDMLLVERAVDRNMRLAGVRCITAGIPDSLPYHCKDFSYGVAAFHAGLHYVIQRKFELCVFLFADAVLGVPLDDIAAEFMSRPEAICGPQWHGSIDTQLMLLKKEAIIDLLYSIPFVPLCKAGSNHMYYEHALSLVFHGRWWNPWPAVRTVRQEWGTPELFQGSESEMMAWPILTKASPKMIEKYREAHPLPLK